MLQKKNHGNDGIQLQTNWNRPKLTKQITRNYRETKESHKNPHRTKIKREEKQKTKNAFQ